MRRAVIRSLGVWLLALVAAGGCGKLSGIDDLHLAPGASGGASSGGASASGGGGGAESSGGRGAGGATPNSGGSAGGAGGAAASGGTAGDGGLDGGGDGGDGGGGCAAGQLLCDGVCVPDDEKNCGTCGHDCTVLPHVVGAVTCQAGVCSYPASACETGYLNCSGDPDDGCDAAINVAARCGSCTRACSGGTPVCSPVTASAGEYECVSGCTSGLSLCGDSCVNLQTDPAHCGSCPRACPVPTGGAATCTGGTTCGVACNASSHACGGACVSNTDPRHCGSLCNTNCPAPTAGGGSAACNGNACALSCPASTKACGTACINVMGNDSANCGDCGRTCGTGTTCSGGTCVCTGSAVSCGGTCVNLQTSAAHCGRCNHSCFGGACSAGVCQPWTVVEPPVATSISSFTSDGEYVIWGDPSAKAVYRVSLTGTGKVALATDASFDGLAQGIAFQMATGGGKVAWVTSNHVWIATIATAGSGARYPFAFTGGFDQLSNVALNSAGTYVALMMSQQSAGGGFPDFKLFSCLISSGSCQSPGTFGYFPQGAAANANNYFFPNAGDPSFIYNHRFGSTSVGVQTTSTTTPQMMAIDATNIYWWNASGASTVGLHKQALAGGNPVRVATTLPDNSAGLTGIGSDGTYVYYGAFGTPPTVLYAPISGCCTGTPFATASNLGKVMVAGGKVFWQDANAIYAMAAR